MNKHDNLRRSYEQFLIPYKSIQAPFLKLGVWYFLLPEPLSGNIRYILSSVPFVPLYAAHVKVARIKSLPNYERNNILSGKSRYMIEIEDSKKVGYQCSPARLLFKVVV